MAEECTRAHNAYQAMTGTHRLLLSTFGIFALVLLSADGMMLSRRARYLEEIDRLRASMTDIERQHADQIVAQEDNKLRIGLALARHQAQLERALHLSVTIDSGSMYLEREGALLRAMPVQLGLEQKVGRAPDTVRLAPPRGLRTIARIVGDSDVWEVPAWVYLDRGLPAPADRRVIGALGPAAIMLDGGTVIYSVPSTGPLADSTYVMPGAVRARAEDLRAILPNLSPGLRVYFY